MVVVEGKAVARGCEKAFSKKIYRAQETSVKRYISFFSSFRNVYLYVRPPTVRNIIRCECKFRPLILIIA